MADTPYPFAEMSAGDKLNTLLKGGVLRLKHWSEGNDHGKYPEAALSRLKQQTATPRVNRNITDRALNYGGGYDFGARDVPIQDAVDMARAYQLMDYMTTWDPKREADAQADFDENVAGVIAAKADRELNRKLSQKERDRKALDWARANFCQGGSVNNYAKGGSVLQRFMETQPQREAQANRKSSVMSKPSEPSWRPEYEYEPGLEPPMISPDDIIGTGIPTKLMALAAKAAPLSMLGVIKPKGGNWLTGSVEGALKNLKKHTDPELEGYARRGQNLMPHEASDVLPKMAINSWIDKALTRYIKNEMATPEDPVRALAERGVLHFEPHTDTTTVYPGLALTRKRAGVPTKGIAESDLAKGWEKLSDLAINSANDAGGLRDQTGWVAEGQEKLLKENPWLMKVPAETRVFEPLNLKRNLGFEHLIDELSNAINPESGLPRQLLIKPEALERVSVPQAVERVAKINEWRAAQKAIADQAKANNAATVLHKEYPEKGMKWVELKAGESANPAYELKRIQGKNGEYWDVRKPGAPYGHTTFTEAEALRVSNREALQDALKYEGDTMGHCVGGYCDDVVSGRSRIFSLRDEKGHPHVTIETTTPMLEPQLGGDVQHPDRIVQIKGKQNRAPNPEYLPFVQDFVKSGKWSDVGDLQNTGLRRSRDVWNEMEQQKIRDAGKTFGEYLSPEEMKAINSEVWPGDTTYNFAQGGSVPQKIQNVQQLSAIINAIRAGGLNA